MQTMAIRTNGVTTSYVVRDETAKAIEKFIQSKNVQLNVEVTKHLSIAFIKAQVSGYMKIPNFWLKGRKREIVMAKKLFCYAARMFTDLSLKKIGEQLQGDSGEYDHTTVLHSINTLKDLMDTEPETKYLVDNFIIRMQKALEDE